MSQNTHTHRTAADDHHEPEFYLPGTPTSISFARIKRFVEKLRN